MAKNTKLVVKVAQRKRTKPYECEICQKSFGIYNYVDHLKTAHGTLKDWPCGKCKTRFTKITRLKIHLREHNGLERHCCGVCGHHSESKGNHEIHMRKHTGGKPHLCQTCEKPFASRSDQIRHEKRVCGKLRKEHPKGNELGLEESSDGYSDDEAANPSPKDNRLCCVCGISDDLNPIPHPDHDELTIFCDSCNKSYHMACVGLEEIPDKWVCEPCDASLRDEFTSLLEKYHKRVCEPCDARLRDEITSLLEKSHKRVCEPCDANLRDEFTSLLGKSHKQVCEPCGANLRDEFISLLEIYHKQDWREVDKEVVNRVRDTRHLAAELWDFVRNLAKEDWREVDKEVINRVRETRHLAAKLWDFVRNLGKEERSKSHDPPSTLTAEESPPTTAMDDATPGSIPDIMPSESLSDVGEDSPPDWHVSADSLQEQGGDIVDPEPDGELDQEQYWEHNRSYNPPPNDPNTVSLWPTFDVGEGMPPNTGIVGIPSWDHTTQINPSLDLGLMSGTHGLVLEGQSNWNGFAFQGMDMNFSPRVPEGSAEGLRGDIWVGGYGQEQCQPYGGTPDRLRSTGGVALEHIGLDGIGGMPPIAVPNSFARPIEPMSNADLGSSSTPLEYVSHSCTNCHAESASGLRRSSRENAILCGVCHRYEKTHGGKSRPEKLWSRPKRKARPVLPTKCATCHTDSTYCWRWSSRKKAKLCKSCFDYDKTHGGESRPEKLWSRPKRKARPVLPTKCATCHTESASGGPWSLSTGAQVCNACYRYELANRKLRPEELWKRPRKEAKHVLLKCTTVRSVCLGRNEI